MEILENEQPETMPHRNGLGEINGGMRPHGRERRFSSAAKRDMAGIIPEDSSAGMGWLVSKKRMLSTTYAVCCVLLVFIVGLASGVPFWLVLLRSVLFAAVSFAAAMVVFMVLEKKLFDPPSQGAPAEASLREDAFAFAAEDDAQDEPAAQPLKTEGQGFTEAQPKEQRENRSARQSVQQPANPSTRQEIGAKNRAGFTRGSAVNIAVGDETPADNENKAAGAAPEAEKSVSPDSFVALDAKPTGAAPVNASKVGYNMRNIFNSANERNVSQVNTTEELKKSRQALTSDPQKFGLALRRWLQDT